MAHERRHNFGWIVLGALGWACSDDASGSAIVEQRSPLGDATQVSELLGFSLDQVLPAGAHVATLTWNENRSGIDFSPAAATTELRWSLALPEPGSERFRIEQVDVECDRTRFITNLDSLCADRLEATLLLHLESEDGALMEDFPVIFDAHSASDLQWRNAELEFGEFAGSFAISASAGDPTSLRLGVFASGSDGDFAGSLIADIITERSKKDGATLTQGAVVTVAAWRGAAAPAAQK